MGYHYLNLSFNHVKSSAKVNIKCQFSKLKVTFALRVKHETLGKINLPQQVQVQRSFRRRNSVRTLIQLVKTISTFQKMAWAYPSIFTVATSEVYAPCS